MTIEKLLELDLEELEKLADNKQELETIFLPLLVYTRPKEVDSNKNKSAGLPTKPPTSKKKKKENFADLFKSAMELLNDPTLK